MSDALAWAGSLACAEDDNTAPDLTDALQIAFSDQQAEAIYLVGEDFLPILERSIVQHHMHIIPAI